MVIFQLISDCMGILDEKIELILSESNLHGNDLHEDSIKLFMYIF